MRTLLCGRGLGGGEGGGGVDVFFHQDNLYYMYSLYKVK